MTEPLADTPIEEDDAALTAAEPTGEPATADVPDAVVEPEGSADATEEGSGEPSDDDTGDGAAGGEPEDAPEPEPTFGLSEADFEREAKKLDKAVTAYRGKVEAFVEATGQSLIPSKFDLDFVPGYVFHPDVKPLDEDQIAFARAMMGEEIGPAFRQDPESHECELCGGWGQVRSGSKIASTSLYRCPDCGGKGYKTRRVHTELPSPSPEVDGDAPAAVLSADEAEGNDIWGTPRTHPDWGKSPQYRGPNWAAELEAWKKGEPAPVG